MSAEQDAGTHVEDTGDRFELHEGEELIGFADYSDNGATRSFPHTEIVPSRRGQGHATNLIGHALDASREAGRHVLPYCSAVLRFIRENPEYADLVPTDRRAEFGL